MNPMIRIATIPLFPDGLTETTGEITVRYPIVR